VELKTVKAIAIIHRVQALNYLRGTGLDLCLMINFAKSKVEVARVVPNDSYFLKTEE
jgi:GxxExxY protein